MPRPSQYAKKAELWAKLDAEFWATTAEGKKRALKRKLDSLHRTLKDMEAQGANRSAS